VQDGGQRSLSPRQLFLTTRMSTVHDLYDAVDFSLSEGGRGRCSSTTRRGSAAVYGWN
jgi:hypothetical protein